LDITRHPNQKLLPLDILTRHGSPYPKNIKFYLLIIFYEHDVLE
jgi:hypothetical protein